LIAAILRKITTSPLTSKYKKRCNLETSLYGGFILFFEKGKGEWPALFIIFLKGGRYTVRCDDIN